MVRGDLENALREMFLARRSGQMASFERVILETTGLADPAPVRLDPAAAAIAPGFDGELDAERTLRDDSRRVIAAMQLDFAQKYGVASLKIKHHQQLGYVIEAPAVAVVQEIERGEQRLTSRFTWFAIGAALAVLTVLAVQMPR